MNLLYFLGIDAAKHKIRAALSAGPGTLLLEKDLPVTATGLAQLLAMLKQRVKQPEQLLVLIEATGLLHFNWSAALTNAGYAVAVINPLIARRLYRVENSIRDNKSDPIDARGLCAIGALRVRPRSPASFLTLTHQTVWGSASTDSYLLGSYRIATAPEPNSSRLTSFKSTCFDSPANNVGPWPASLGCTTNSYSSINPSSANASGSFTPPTNSPLPDSRLSC